MRMSVYAAVILAVTASSASAERGLLSVGGFAGTGFSNGGEAIEGFQYTEFRPGVILGGSILYRFPAGHSIELGAEHLAIQMRELGENIGTLELIPVLVSYSFQWRSRSRAGGADSTQARVVRGDATGFTWHVDLGAGISLTDFKKGPLLKALEDTFGWRLIIDTDNPLALKIGAGVGFFLYKNLSVTLDSRVVLGDVGTTWVVSEEGVTSPVEQIDKFSAGTTQFGVGLRFWY